MYGELVSPLTLHINQTTKTKRKIKSMQEQPWSKPKPNPETTNIFSPPFLSSAMTSVVTNSDLSLSILTKISQQNGHFSESIGMLNNQLKRLNELSEGLQQENGRLRSHYYQRSNDVRKIVESIKVNVGKQVSDVNHQIYLLREGNCMIFKNIELEIKKTKQCQERIDELTKKFNSLNNGNVELQQKIYNELKVRLQNNLNSGHIAKLTRRQQDLNKIQQQLWTQVAELTYSIGKLQKNNVADTKQTLYGKNQNENDKHYYKNNIIQALKSLGELKNDLENQKSIQKSQMQILNQLKIKLKQMQQKKINKNIQKQRKLAQFIKLKSIKQEQANRIIQLKTRNPELEIQIMQKNEQKDKLIKQLLAKKKSLEIAAQKQNTDKNTLKNTAIETIKQTQQKIELGEIKYEQEVKQINLQKGLAQGTVNQLQVQFKQLVKDHEYYSGMCKKFTNPVQEIERAQFRLALKEKNRKPNSIF